MIIKKLSFGLFFLITILVCSVFSGCAPSEKTTEATVTASSSESDSLLPKNVFDGNLQTRWSSLFSDPQWLIIDLGNIQDIAGLTLNWEAAYGKSYDILLSKDGDTWKQVYATTDGDGKTDEIYFERTAARYIKLTLKERGTFWGYSLWEVSIKGPEKEVLLKASSFQRRKGPSNAMDGNINTEWMSKTKGEEWVTVDLREEKGFGGIQLNWGTDYARTYEILTSSDGTSWKKIFSTDRGNGGKDLIYFDVTRIRYIKIFCKESATKVGYSIKEITLKGADEFATPQKHYELLAEESPKGYYPKWISKQQAYWTVVGVDGDDKESLLCEDGTIEPYFKSYSLMPYIYLNGKLVTSEDSNVTQSLEKGYLPIPTVKWDYDGIILNQRLFAAGERGKSATYIWYTLENNSKDGIAGKLYLTIRPFQVNPPWQYGGLSEIRSLEYYDMQTPTVKVNEKEAVLLLTKPDNFGALTFKEGDVVNVIEKGVVPLSRNTEDKDGNASGALEYNFNLSSGAQANFFFIIPLHNEIPQMPAQGEEPEQYFNDLLQKTIAYWESKLEAIQIDIPDVDIVKALKSNLAYILINNDGVRLQPGSRNYKKAWMRDGAIISAALLRMGYKEEVKEFLDWVTSQQLSDGMIPFMLEENGIPDWAKDWKEYDSQGEFIYAVLEYYNFTKDMEFLQEKLPAVEKALKFLVELRKQRMTDEFKDGPDEKKIFYGILPESNSHEGYFPAQHSYWDDFWALKGWKDARTIAELLGREDLIKWIDTEETDFKKCVYDSINLVMKLKGIDYIPGCAEKGDFDATSTAIAIFPCEEYENLPQPQLDNTFKKYYYDTFLPRLKEDWRGGFTPYEVRSISAFIFMDQKEKALKMLKYFLTVMRPREWNHLAEVVFSEYRHPQYIGDMPHTWIGAEYINAVRNIFAYEKDDKLILGAGIPSEWTSTEEGIAVRNFPTYYGDINYTVKRGEKGLKLEIWGDAKPPKGFIFKSPISGKEFTFSELSANIVITE